jgi:hypothetical protein
MPQSETSITAIWGKNKATAGKLRKKMGHTFFPFTAPKFLDSKQFFQLFR